MWVGQYISLLGHAASNSCKPVRCQVDDARSKVDALTERICTIDIDSNQMCSDFRISCELFVNNIKFCDKTTISSVFRGAAEFRGKMMNSAAWREIPRPAEFRGPCS